MKITAVGAAGLGAAAVGLGRVLPAGAGGFDDAKGGSSLIGAVRLIPERSYVGVPELLEKYIKGDATAWDQIKGKINYTYGCLGDALWPVLLLGALKDTIQGEIKRGKQLFFKVNAITPDVISLKGDGSPGSGVVASTDWAFVAALMRFLHDKLSIRYYQMAAGEAGSYVPAYSSLLGCTAEALLEGTRSVRRTGSGADGPSISCASTYGNLLALSRTIP